MTANNVGGGCHWREWRKKIGNLLRTQSSELRVTTMFDFYAFPTEELVGLVHPRDTDARIAEIEHAMETAVNDRRFIPHLQKHEFEALVLASIDSLHEYLDPVDQPGLQQLRRSIDARPPEEVNDGASTAPSKRLLQYVPTYHKVVHGPDSVKDLGLDELRRRCPHFGAWLTTLEALNTGAD